MPHTEELAILIVGDLSLEKYKRDIIVSSKYTGLKQISIFHPAYMPLQYPLLFPYGERGYQLGIPYQNIKATNNSKRKRTTVTMHEFYKYHVHYRPNQANPFLCYGRLSKQAVVDARAMEDEDRLMYIARNQDKLRVEYLQGIFDAIEKGLSDGSQIGKRTLLPSSHVGSRRYVIQNYHDGIAICRVYGPPDLFVTFTCNPKWPEITLMLLQGQQPNDRPDIIVRVFHMKLKQVLKDIESGLIFGPIVAILYSIEFQKRGLPHVHILVWLNKSTYEITPDIIDKWISAEIPNPMQDPLGYILVSEHMMHGPCGDKNEKCPCMKKGKCSKYYPKEFQDETHFNDSGFTQYRRRDTKIFIRRDNHNLDNKWVVPHNLQLLKKYQAHINVEYVNKSKLLKYLCKYVNKGPDKATVIFQRIKQGEDPPENEQTKKIDEIKEYLDCRYICEQDALWRLFGFDIHYHYPSVERLPVHLPLYNTVKLQKTTKLKILANDPKIRRTKLTEWFQANRQHEEARELTYCEFPQYWTWNESKKTWTKRKNNFKIGRLYYVNPAEGERFYLRMLLMIVKGATDYTDIRTYNGIVFPTFKDACAARGLLKDDNEWYKTFDEASNWATASQLRNLFTTILLFCDLQNERKFYEENWRKMVDDIERNLVARYHPVTYSPNEIEIQDLLLDELQQILAKNGANINNYNFPQRSNKYKLHNENHLIQDELDYNVDSLEEEANRCFLKLNEQQRNAFQQIVNSVINKQPNIFFCIWTWRYRENIFI
jgi:hypothetical protein